MLLSGKNDFPKLWQQWNDRIVFDRIDNATAKLIPFLYLRLKELNIGDDEIKRIKGVNKFTWYKNLFLIDSARKIIPLFNKENIPVILLKGVPLLKNVYKNTARGLLAMLICSLIPTCRKSCRDYARNDWAYHDQSPFAINRSSTPFQINILRKLLLLINRMSG